MSETLNTETGEVFGGIIPALHTLREIPGLDAKMAVAIHDAVAAVRAQRKAATVTITLEIKLLKDGVAKLEDEPITISGEVDTKLPRPPAPLQWFFIDEDGNPTKTAKPRQRGLELTIGGGSVANAA